MGWFLAPALVSFNAEVQRKFPNRGRAYDGTIGDASHAARYSDHNPCWSCSGSSYGIVRASDRDISNWPAEACVQYLVARCRSGAENRIEYIISNRRIFSRPYGFSQRYYSGSNPHDHHFHVSLRHDSSNFDTRPFLPTFPTGSTPPPPPPPAIPKDWFDMATKDELRAVVREEIAATLQDTDWLQSSLGSTAGWPAGPDNDGRKVRPTLNWLVQMAVQQREAIARLAATEDVDLSDLPDAWQPPAK